MINYFLCIIIHRFHSEEKKNEWNCFFFSANIKKRPFQGHFFKVTFVSYMIQSFSSSKPCFLDRIYILLHRIHTHTVLCCLEMDFSWLAKALFIQCWLLAGNSRSRMRSCFFVVLSSKLFSIKGLFCVALRFLCVWKVSSLKDARSLGTTKQFLHCWLKCWLVSRALRSSKK